MKDFTKEEILELLEDTYNQALSTHYVRKPWSWALYRTWEIIDRKEKKRQLKKFSEVLDKE